MPKQTIQIDKPGVYLFKDPARAKMTIFRELVVTFYSRKTKSVGFLFYHPDESPKDLDNELHIVYEKLRMQANGHFEKPEVKVFGLANENPPLLQQLSEWLKTKELDIAASDIGRNAKRSLLIDCGSGKVGVGYSESSVARTTEMIDTGSARNRNPVMEASAEVLILTHSNVKRTLAKQAVEEHSNWAASVPKNADDFLKRKTFSDFVWSVVILFDDMTADEKLSRWVESVKAQFPTVEFRWSGASLPAFTKKLTFVRQLPPLEPFLVRDFKNQLGQAVFTHAIADTNDLLPFKKKRKTG